MDMQSQDRSVSVNYPVSDNDIDTPLSATSSISYSKCHNDPQSRVPIADDVGVAAYGRGTDDAIDMDVDREDFAQVQVQRHNETPAGAKQFISNLWKYVPSISHSRTRPNACYS